MKKYRFLMLLTVAFFAFAVSGCTIISEIAPPAAEKIPVKKQEYDAAQSLIRAFVKNDAAAFVALLPEETRSKFTVENFKQTRKALVESVGEPISYQYLTTLELQTLHPQIWRIRFRRHNINMTKEFTSELLFRVVTGMINDKEAVITGFQFL